jgi:hypothetical protein
VTAVTANIFAAATIRTITHNKTIGINSYKLRSKVYFNEMSMGMTERQNVSKATEIHIRQRNCNVLNC